MKNNTYRPSDDLEVSCGTCVHRQKGKPYCKKYVHRIHLYYVCSSYKKSPFVHLRYSPEEN